jgi:hypothetical protein
LTERKLIATSVAIAKLNSKGAAAMPHTLINLEEHIESASTAEWRWRKAAEFPDDHRNEKAAEELERIAEQIKTLEGSEIHQQIDEACQLLNNLIGHKRNCFGWEPIIERVSDELRSIGFHKSHTGMSLLQWYCNLLRHTAQDYLDEIVPAPDLQEQVEDDPDVRAAREAYERARAKAYAEARKRL